MHNLIICIIVNNADFSCKQFSRVLYSSIADLKLLATKINADFSCKQFSRVLYSSIADLKLLATKINADFSCKQFSREQKEE